LLQSGSKPDFHARYAATASLRFFTQQGHGNISYSALWGYLPPPWPWAIPRIPHRRTELCKRGISWLLASY